MNIKTLSMQRPATAAEVEPGDGSALFRHARIGCRPSSVARTVNCGPIIERSTQPSVQAVSRAFNIDFAKTRIGEGISTQLRNAKILIKNLGKGPAYGVSIKWMSNASLALAKCDFDVEGVNQILRDADLVLNWTTEGKTKKMEIHRISSETREYAILLEPVYHSFDFDCISENEEVSVPVPADGIYSHILLSLNEIAHEIHDGSLDRIYGHYIFKREDVLDTILISTKSITDEMVEYVFGGRFDGGCYIPSQMDDGEYSMIAMIGHSWKEQKNS